VGRVFALLMLLVIPIEAEAHAEIFFPKVFSSVDLPTTGFVLLNADPTIATVNFYFLSVNGQVLSGPPAVQVPPGGQLARLGTELFSNVTTDGWVYVITDTESMQAFWLNYDANLTYLDGAEAIQLDGIGADQIIPLVAENTELSVISLYAAVPVTIHLFGATMELAPAVTRTLAIASAFRASVSTMFPGIDLSQARYLRIQTPGAPIASTAIIKAFQVPVDSAVVNGINAGSRTEMIFPHVVNGSLTGANYTTVVGVTNLSRSAQTVTISFVPSDGPSIDVTRTLAANGSLRETAQSLFELSSDFQTGWVHVTGTAALTGFASYSDTVAGGLAAVPAAAAQTNLFFLHIADGPPQWQTGVALLNTSNTTAQIEMYAMTPANSLIGSASFSIEPGKKIAKVIHELIPQTRGVNGGFVYVRTTNNVPIYGLELFYSEDLKVLSNVAAGKLNFGITYNPPSQ
jgi:hypothetical protein